MIDLSQLDVSSPASCLVAVLVLAEVLRRARPWRVLARARSRRREQDPPHRGPDSGTWQAETATTAAAPLTCSTRETHILPGQC